MFENTLKKKRANGLAFWTAEGKRESLSARGEDHWRTKEAISVMLIAGAAVTLTFHLRILPFLQHFPRVLISWGSTAHWHCTSSI